MEIAAQPCRFDELSMAMTATPPLADRVGLVIVLTNTGARSCVLSGCPHVESPNDRGGSPVSANPTPSGPLGGLGPGRSPNPVLVAVGQSASVLLEAATGWTDCPLSGRIEITLRAGDPPTNVPWLSNGCRHLEVHPFVPGSTGSQP